MAEFEAHAVLRFEAGRQLRELIGGDVGDEPAPWHTAAIERSPAHR